ncbi:hypothetical protein DJ68_05340, partial [Halorubrum sp. C3]
GALLGIGALSGVLSSFSWPSLPEFDAPDWLPPDVPEPGWTPIGVEDPAEAPVEDPKQQPSADPREQPVEEPKEQPVEEPKEQPVEEPEWKVQVEEPGFEVPVEEPESTGEPASESTGPGALKTIFGLSALGAGGAGAYALRNTGSTAARGAAGAGAFLTPEMAGATDQDQFNRRRRSFNKQTPGWLELPEMEGENKYPGSVFSAEGRQAQVEGVRELVNAIKDFREDVRSTQKDTSSTRRTEVNVESNVTVDGATRREVERAAEEAKQQAIRELTQKLRGR